MIKDFTIRILSDNTAGPLGIMAEYGMALHLDCDGEQILFDTGQGLVLLNNAAAMELDLMKIEKIALSHGHWDHTGGLLAFAKLKGSADVYAHPDVFSKRFAPRGGKENEIGIPFSREELEAQGLRFNLDKKTREICPGLLLSGEVERVAPLAKTNFTRLTAAGYETDQLFDDQFLLAKTAWGNILILGCTHAGLYNTLVYAKKLAGGEKIKAILGGMHLLNMNTGQIAPEIEQLTGMGVEYAAPIHCSGMLAMCMIRAKYGVRFIEGKAGMTLRFTEEELTITA